MALIQANSQFLREDFYVWFYKQRDMIGLNGMNIHTALTTFSFKNPITYLLIAASLFIVAFKVFALLRLKRAMHGRQGEKRSLVQNILEAHKPTLKKQPDDDIEESA